MSWSTIADIPVKIAEAGVASDSNGNIYVTGGFTESTNYNKTTYVWDGSSWSSPIEDLDEGRQRPGLAVADGAVLKVIGGYTETDGSTQSVVYRSEEYGWLNATALPQSLFNVKAISDDVGRIFVVGSGSNKIFRGPGWDEVTTLPGGRGDVGLATNTNGDLYIAGGYGYEDSDATEKTVLDGFYKWDGSSLTQLPDLPQSLQQPASTNIGDNIYVIGGDGSKSVYEWDQNSWSTLPDLPQELAPNGAVSDDSGNIYVVGGNGPGSYGDPVSKVYKYQAVTPPATPSGLSLQQL